MRVVLHTTGKAATSAGGTMFSVVIHAVLIVGAVSATGARSRELARSLADRITFIHYLTPPDRVRSTEHLEAAIHYVPLGPGGVPLLERADGRIFHTTGALTQELTGGALGAEEKSLASSRDVPSTDSVYSILDVEDVATRTAGSAAPIYPSDLLRTGTEGSVVVRFVVDTLGHPDSASIVVVGSTHAAFTQSVRHAIPLMTFTPASTAGRKVRQLVEQRFGFKVKPVDVPPPSATPPVS